MHTSIHKAYFCDKENRKLSLPRDQALFLLRILYGELIDVSVWQWTKSQLAENFKSDSKRFNDTILGIEGWIAKSDND